MRREKIASVLKHGKTGETPIVCGWVRSKRESKGFAFIVLNDGSCQDNLQLVVDAGTPAWDALAKCNTGAALSVTKGTLRTSQGREQGVEMHCTELKVLGEADGEKFPLQKKGHTLEFLREIGHLRARTNTFGAVYRVRSVLALAVHDFFRSRGFYYVHTPIITASDCEGAGQMFQVTTLDLNKPPRTQQGQIDFGQDFFGKPAHLTVSGQLEGEMLAMALGDIYTFGPTFRAENSNTTRHLSEFWMIEPEMAFADLEDDMELAESFFRHLCRSVLESCPAELAFLEKQYKGISIPEIQDLAEKPFARMTYTEAVEELKKAKVKFEFPVDWGTDLQSEHERYLTEQVFKSPVIVRNYPKDFKAFYMRMNDDNKTVAAMDVLAPRIGEIMGGSQREERLDRLEARIVEMKLPVHDMQWYLDSRRYGSNPHAGFGLGFERVVQYLTGMGNIRDVIPFPRAPKTIDF